MKILFGTYRLKNNEVKSVEKALQIGYEGIDCASIYNNEKDIGQVLTNLNIQNKDIRQKYWIQTKIWRSVKKEKAISTLKKSLKSLNINFVNCWLIHWPGPGRHLAFPPVMMKNGQKVVNPNPKVTTIPQDWEPQDRLQIYKEMSKAIELGLTKYLGVCNFSPQLLNQLLEFCKKESLPYPYIVQNEFHPFLHNKELLDLCKKNKIIFQAYASLGSGNNDLLDHELIQELSLKYNRHKSNILLQWALQQGCVILPKSKNDTYIENNFKVISEPFKISESDMKKIGKLDQKKINQNTLYGWIKEHDPNFYL